MGTERKELLIIIPAYNEAKTIGKLLDDLEGAKVTDWADLLVINDASNDGTGKLVRARSDESKQEETIKKLRDEFDRITAEISTMNKEQKAAEQEIVSIREQMSQKDTEYRKTQELYQQKTSY